MGKVSIVNKLLLQKCHLFRKKIVTGPPETAVGTWESLFHSEVFFMSLQMGAWKTRYFVFPCSHIQGVQEDFCLKAQATTNHSVNPRSEGSWRLPAPRSVELRVPRVVQRGPRVFTSSFQARMAGSLWKRCHEEVQGGGETLRVKSGRNSTLQLPTALSVRSLKIAFLS